MNIGLLDIDGYSGRKKQWGAHVYPNLALCKIAAYHKQQGDNVEWYTAFTDNDYYDFVYMSKIFNFTPDYPYLITNTKRIIRGGTGYMNDTSEKVAVYDLKKYGLNNKKITNSYSAYLPEEIDRMQPDYSIYPHIPTDTAYGFLTRGCPNSCKWCVVPQKEGKIYPYMDIDEIAINGRNKIILMDNNILAAGSYAKEQLQKIIDRGYYVDFNQALDARLVTPRKKSCRRSMTDKVQKILSEITTRKLCTMDEHMAFYNDKAKEDYRLLSEIEEFIKALQEEPVSEQILSNVQRTGKDWKEPVSGELDYASEKYACRFSGSKYGHDKVKDAFIAGTDWQKEQMMAKVIDAEVKVDAGGYPYIPQIELWDYDKDEPLAEDGNKVKVIVIKED